MYFFLLFIYPWEIEKKGGNNIPSLQPMTASTMVLIFSLAIFRCGRYYSHFFWIISPSQAYLFSQRFCLSSSFSPPLGSPLRPPSLALIRSIPHTLPFSSNFSSALFLTGQRALSLSYSADVAGRLRGCGWGWRAAPHILSAYQSWGPVCSIPLWSISQPLSQCVLPRSTPSSHWQMVARAPDTNLFSSCDHSVEPVPYSTSLQDYRQILKYSIYSE